VIEDRRLRHHSYTLTTDEQMHPRLVRWNKRHDPTCSRHLREISSNMGTRFRRRAGNRESSKTNDEPEFLHQRNFEDQWQSYQRHSQLSLERRMRNRRKKTFRPVIFSARSRKVNRCKGEGLKYPYSSWS
jgi:hypothetical protein